MYRSRRGPARVATLAIALALGITACGDDSTNTAAADDKQIFCDEYLALSESFAAAPGGPEDPPPAELKQFYAANVEGHLEKLAKDTAPDEIKDEVATLVDIARGFGETGDVSGFETPDAETAASKADGYVYDNCGFQTVDATGADYVYEAMPEQLDARATAIRLTNHTKAGEFHEMVVLRKNEGVSESFEDLLALPPEEAMTKATLLGTAFTPPDESAYLFADLEPGSYVAVCFLPKGFTNPEGPPPEGPPHFMLGMSQEFTVT